MAMEIGFGLMIIFFIMVLIALYFKELNQNKQNKLENAELQLIIISKDTQIQLVNALYENRSLVEILSIVNKISVEDLTLFWGKLHSFFRQKILRNSSINSIAIDIHLIKNRIKDREKEVLLRSIYNRELAGIPYDKKVDLCLGVLELIKIPKDNLYIEGRKVFFNCIFPKESELFPFSQKEKFEFFNFQKSLKEKVLLKVKSLGKTTEVISEADIFFRLAKIW